MLQSEKEGVRGRDDTHTLNNHYLIVIALPITFSTARRLV